MRLATLADGTRDGHLVVVAPDGESFASAREVAPNLQRALDDWRAARPGLVRIHDTLVAGGPRRPLGPERLLAPLPRAYEWVDGSAYLEHVRLVRRARGAEPPATLETEPLVYQGGSGVLLGPHDPLVLLDPSFGLDFEAEICVVLLDTPAGTSADRAAAHVALLLLANDVTLRHLVPDELAKGFGFFCSKPATAFSPFAVTPDELGGAFRLGRVFGRVETRLDGVLVGDPEAGPEMHFSFFDLVAHVTRTRSFTAGTILGSGTVSNRDPARGVSCLAERRTREILADGAARTPFLAPGSRVEIEMRDASGRSIFGAIRQEVVLP